jgi:DNA-binding Lrp family transcriptional regulator
MPADDGSGAVFHRVVYHQQIPANRREVVPPELEILKNAPLAGGTVEIHRRPDGSIEWLLGATSLSDLQSNASAYERLFPGGAVHPEIVPCALPGHPAGHWVFAYARGHGHHWTPMETSPSHDYADGLVRALSSSVAKDHEVVVHLVFQREPSWGERIHIFTSPKDRLLLSYQGYSVSLTGDITKTTTPMQWQQQQHTRMMDRLKEPAYHLEIRVAVHGPAPEKVIGAIQDQWLRQFKRGEWRHLRQVKKKHNVEFDQIFRSHAMDGSFCNPKERRDVSLTEFLSFYPPPRSAMYPGMRYYREHEGLEEGGGRSAPPPLDGPAPDGGVSLVPPDPPLPSHPAKFPAPLPPIQLGLSFSREASFLSDPWYHAAVMGATGTGKSTLLLQWILETLMKRPDGIVIVIDPHGTLSDAVKARLPPELAGQVIELDPAKLRFVEGAEEKVALPMNLLALPDLGKMTEDQKTLAGDIIVGNLTYFIRNIWGNDVFGPQIDHNVSSLANGLLEIPGTNLVDMYYVLTDPKARAMFARLVRTETYRKFAVDELPRLTNTKYSQDRVSSTLNRLGKIVNNPLLRISLCQRANPVDFKDLLANHRLILINLSKTTIGDEASRFLGAMLFARIWLAILQRGISKQHTYLFVDEFQNFVTPSIAHVLTEARKYNLHIVMANQYLEQMPREIRDAVVQNVNAWCFFRMGVNDEKQANAILRPGRRGWTDDTVVSLGDRRFLFAFRNRLEMVYTVRPRDSVADPRMIDRLVQTSTRRYAADETSMNSPFSVDDRQVKAVLEALAKDGPLTFDDLVARVKFHRAEIWAAMRRAEQDGFLSYDPAIKKNSLTALGSDHVKGTGAKHENRLEGAPHTALLSRFMAYSCSQGYAMVPVPQGNSNHSLPDGEITISGETVNVEIECSTLDQGEQVVKNLLKAKDAKRRCIFVVESRERAVRVVELLTHHAPGSLPERDYVVLYVEGQKFQQFPGDGDGPRFSGILPGVSDSPEGGDTAMDPPARAPTREGMSEDTALVDDALATLARKLLEKEPLRTTVTYEEILNEIPPESRGRLTPTRLGMVLKSLKVRTMRVWEGTGEGRRRVTVAVLTETDDDDVNGGEEQDGAPVQP